LQNRCGNGHDTAKSTFDARRELFVSSLALRWMEFHVVRERHRLVRVRQKPNPATQRIQLVALAARRHTRMTSELFRSYCRARRIMSSWATIARYFAVTETVLCPRRNVRDLSVLRVMQSIYRTNPESFIIFVSNVSSLVL